MRISKYFVVIVLAVMALGMMMAYGQCSTQQDRATGLISDKPHAIVGAAHPGTHVDALVASTRASHDQCVQSCAKTFSDKYSAGYKACVKGC